MTQNSVLKYKILEVDNVKANLHGLILLMIMVKNNASLEINIEKSLISIILEYLEEDIDLAYNIYTLRWKKKILYGDYRNYVKKINHIKYKANILTCHYLEDIFYLVVEDWEHTIWSCDDNEKTEYDILMDLDNEKYKIVRILAKEIVNFFNASSNILIIERQLLEEIWENCYLNIRSGIWLQRCSKKVNGIENRKGVTKGDKKRKRIISEIDEIEVNSKIHQKNIKKLKKNS
ncbi:hypothetical protein RhiirA4_472961 [Rhizophagus irregularis]|uniref:Uncharacterized protein n=1 Tax=Rhizophagus irregularis TaxID=588596 RepID=A0A2I1H5V8_9GLOM|nr:hypothetical protein RhiirA4_472961 [Rhizophagus irregularis]